MLIIELELMEQNIGATDITFRASLIEILARNCSLIRLRGPSNNSSAFITPSNEKSRINTAQNDRMLPRLLNKLTKWIYKKRLVRWNAQAQFDFNRSFRITSRQYTRTRADQ